MVTKIVYFDYAAVVISITLIICCILKKMTRGKVNRNYLTFAIVVFLVSLLGSCAVTIDNAGPGHLVAKYFFHSGYLFFHTFTALIYLSYLVVLTDTWHLLKKHNYHLVLLFGPMILVALLLFINFFTPIFYYFDENDVYSRTKFFCVLYITGLYYLTYGVVFIIKNKQSFPTRMTTTVFALYPLTILSTILEMLFPTLVIELFANALSLTIIYTNMQRQEDIICPDTLLYNSHIYAFETKNSFFTGKEFAIIIYNVTNYKTLKELIGYSVDFNLSRTIAQLIERINSENGLNAKLFYLKNGQYRLVVDKKHFSNIEIAAQVLNGRAKLPLKANDMNVNMVVNTCVVYCPEDIKTFDGVMSFGKDLNDAKHYTGRVLYAKELYKQDYYDKVLDMNRIIERALATNGFQMYYQPIYSVEEDRITSAEALLRLKDEKYGYISPELFIPAAEKSGAIHKIGYFVLDDVCRFVSSEEFKKLGIEYVEVNLSVAQCMQDNLSTNVLGILNKYGVTPDKINLEITETALAQSEDIFVRNLHSLVDSGLNISLDDFGSGYSNLQRIAQLPFEIVKIDKSFTDNCLNQKVKVMMENIIHMAVDLNLKLVVEGVETEEMLKLFEDLHCHYIQGYYFSKPIPETEFITFVSNFSGVRA